MQCITNLLSVRVWTEDWDASLLISCVCVCTRVFFWLTGTTCFEGSIVSLSVGPDRGITRGRDRGRDPS